MPTTRANFFTRNFIGNQVIVQVFRELDWFSVVIGSKVMAKKRQKIREFPRNPFGDNL